MDTQLEKSNLENWQRLSPLSILFFIGKFISSLMKEAFAAFAPLGIIIFNSDNKFWVITLILVGLLVVTLVSGFLQYWFYKFKLDKQKVLINDGVFKKNHRVIQFDRVQNINVLQPIYFKPFELVTLQIETAGAKGNEVDLAGIAQSKAGILREEILQFQQSELSKEPIADNEVEQEIQEESIATADTWDLVKYGVSSNGMFWFFVIIAPLFSFSDELFKKWFSPEDFQLLASKLGEGATGSVLLTIIIIISLVLLMALFSILGAIIRYHNYHLTLKKDDSNYQNSTIKRSSGLITKYQESVKIKKIQSITIRSNFIGRWLKVEHLTLGQVSTNQVQGQQKKSLFIVPARTKMESEDIQSKVFDALPAEIPTQKISKRYINKTLIVNWFLPSLVLSCFVSFTSENYWLLVLPFILSLITLPLVIKRWKAFGYGMKDGYAIFKSGLFGFKHTKFPLYKVQRAEVRQSPIQRRKNLATIKVYLASGHEQMEYIPYKEALKWLEIIGTEIEETNLAWY